MKSLENEALSIRAAFIKSSGAAKKCSRTIKKVFPHRKKCLPILLPAGRILSVGVLAQLG